MPLTDKSTPVTQKMHDILEARKVPLGLADVYYGDQDQIPTFPAACVFSGPRTRRVTETGKPEVVISVTIIIYFGRIQSSELNIKRTEEISEAVEDELHKNRSMDGLVVHGYVTSVDPGVALKNDVMIKATRITWEARSQKLFAAG